METNKEFRVCILIEATTIPQATFDLINWLKHHSDFKVNYILIPSKSRNLEMKPSFFQKFINSLNNIGWRIIQYFETFHYKKFHSDHLMHSINISHKELILDLRECFSSKIELSASNISRLKESKIDLILAFNLNQYANLLKKFSKLGLIAFDHYDQKNKSFRPIGFEEVVSKQGKTGFSVIRLLRDVEGIEILFQGAFPTHNYFLANHLNILRRRNFYIKKHILFTVNKNLNNHQTEFTEIENIANLDLIPTLKEQISYIFLLFRNRFTSIKNKLLSKGKFWKVGFVYSDWENFYKSEVHEIENLNNCYLADPFVMRVEGKNYCLAEEYSYDTSKGSIVAYELKGNKSSRIGRVIEESFHMSFPYLFEFKDKIFMVPETSENNDIRIYESLEFPNRWKLNQVVMTDVFAVDSMIFRQKNKWWLFTNINPDGASDACSELYIFSSDDPLSKNWEPHLHNPVIVNSDLARNGGILYKNNKIFRVSQKQNFGRYGAEFSINEIIKLTNNEFIEKKVKHIKPDFIYNGLATHHCHSNSSITVFDYLT